MKNPDEQKRKYGFLYRNGLTLVFMLLAFVFLLGQAYTGMQEHNRDMREAGEPAVGLWQYLHTGHFIQATFENWESEFLQMGIFVVFTIFLYQQGSSESKPPGEKTEVDREPQPSPDAPWPVRKGGIVLAVYKHSLSIALFLLFAFSWAAHLWGSWKDHAQQRAAEKTDPGTLWQYLGSSRFWFESLQNWQSEFLSVACLIFLSIYLRQKGSPQSKPVDMPYDKTE